MANREDWERGGNRGWDRDRDRYAEDRYDEGFSEPYRSHVGEERRGRWASSERFGRRGSFGGGWGRPGWEREEEGYRGMAGYGPSRAIERRGDAFEQDWDRYSREGSARYGPTYPEIGGESRGERFGGATYREGRGREGMGREEWDRSGFSQRSFRRGYGSDWRRGPHAGRGPKGWKRSDERIREDVNEALARDPDLDASSIEITVANAEVTIRGVVEDRDDKRLAEDITEDIFGVEDVHNELKVRRGAFARLTGEKADEQDEQEARRSATTTRSQTSTRNSTRTR